MGYLIDTCVWIDVERGKIGPADVARITGKEPVFLSPVTIAELQFGVEMAIDPGIRIARQKAVDALKRKSVLRIDEETASIFGRLAGELRKAGRDRAHRAQDLWIAAGAIQLGLTLLTDKGKDFKDIPGLRIASLH
jgi:predicted nucleic acid-binding protein